MYTEGSHLLLIRVGGEGGSGESGYSECGVRGEGYSECGSGYSECGVGGRADTVNAGSGESGYSECGVRGERIQ
ncbi:unnamed protein product [Staurois parvus]|uniref:Uncharacterized protein n=1 Tax=Staurois parvus TaxID=386267 RepID=A0ABN9F613_9NEOB|nr:unnamed protein product [Staurois parvus]